MHSYRLKAVENYKDAFKLMHITEINCFNSRSYFYCIDNGINPLTVLVDLSRVPLIAEEGWSHVKLLKELWDRTEQMGGCERAILSKSHQSDASYAAQLGGQERSYLAKTESPYSLS
jgi:hypothetical protein